MFLILTLKQVNISWAVYKIDGCFLVNELLDFVVSTNDNRYHVISIVKTCGSIQEMFIVKEKSKTICINCRSSLPRFFCKKALLLFYKEFTGKHRCWSLFLVKLEADSLQVY